MILKRLLEQELKFIKKLQNHWFNILKIVRQNLVKDNSGWILDGYPRNLSQANSLNAVLNEINQPLELVFYLDIPE